MLSFSVSKKYIFTFLLFVIALVSCQTDYEEPEISLDAYQIVDGFDLEVVASEPFLEAPVAIDFDNRGRIWTVEMRGYMQTLTGESEDMPNGVISILEDKDGDGVIDHSKVFLDNLVLPRAIAHVYGGLLYAEPPNLWFVEIENDKPGKKVLVDSLYATEGNVEHQPNGLMMNIDNWIYNSRSHFRYQRKNGVWKKEPTTLRGQWGISKDNFGRLYYNTNSTQLVGDYVFPNVHIQNEYFQPRAGVGKVLTRNQRVYPLHATLVNRGYQKGVLDADSMLVNVTSACGPLIYRGGQFPAEYDQNAFVCAPEVNIVKRNILSFDGPFTTAEQAYDDHEFLAATDEGFRPVNLFNGPDGAMYIVDMHRGIIQHGAYMTSYLRERLAERGLDKVIGMGRVLKVKSQDTPLLEVPDLEAAASEELVNLLSHQNGWVRDRAQQLLIHLSDDQIVDRLKEVILNSGSGIEAVHAVYALHGMGWLESNLLIEMVTKGSRDLAAHCLLLLREYKEYLDGNAEVEMMNAIQDQSDPIIDLYAIAYLGSRSQDYENYVVPMTTVIAKKHDKDIYYDAAVSAIAGYEEDFLDDQRTIDIGQPEKLVDKVTATLKNRRADKKYWIHQQATIPSDDRTKGLKLFRTTCTACHGQGGEGIDQLAPPLQDSEYIKGSKKRLALILLHGLKGPVHVNGTRYEFNAHMPGIADNTTISDQDIADLITYLSNAFGNSRREINAQGVKELRSVKPKEGAFTEEELKALIDDD